MADDFTKTGTVPTVTLKFTNMPEFQAKIKTISPVFIKQVSNAMEKAARLIHGTAVDLVPVGATSQLRDSLDVDLRPLEASVFSSMPYAAAVEFGTKPHPVPPEALRLWARRVLGNENLRFAVSRKIAQRGTKAQSFLGKAVKQNEGRIRSILEEAVPDAEVILRE